MKKANKENLFDHNYCLIEGDRGYSVVKKKMGD